ncbi:phage holin family protein [Mucilaginibacter sp. UR6-1]|uniref:phage holin family protein n=1 Tax=Mucilaginibacter sp. UR6-1 TaxID=1435643 RepID=UPI001E5AAC3A|nr:phage holin family protein [Mucilaginibacter sp. UR6-1]MCC8409926.1 phage holin family protein [Mucilaginibacter sp. UR6-1]
MFNLFNFFNGLWSFISKFLLWFLVFTTPIHQFLITIYVLLLVDLITGIYSKVVIKKEPLTSKRLKDTTTKFIFYSFAVFIGLIVDIAMLGDSELMLARIVAGYIMLTEFQSGIENISIITGTNLWVMIKDKVTELFNSKITKQKNENN